MQLEPEHIGELIKRLNEYTEKMANRSLQVKDITLAQMKILIVLEQMETHSCTLKELEHIFDLTQATIAGLVTRLERKGMVEGYIEPSDRRIKHIRLSKKGLALCMCEKHNVEENERYLVHALDEEEREELFRLLLKVYDSLEKSGNDT